VGTAILTTLAHGVGWHSQGSTVLLLLVEFICVHFVAFLINFDYLMRFASLSWKVPSWDLGYVGILVVAVLLNVLAIKLSDYIK